MAYADLLVEEGDPRGEFIQVQLALEDPSRGPAERAELKRREEELLARHQAEWIGEAAPVFIWPRKWTVDDRASWPFGLKNLAHYEDFQPIIVHRAAGSSTSTCPISTSPSPRRWAARRRFGCLRYLTIRTNDHDAPGIRPPRAIGRAWNTSGRSSSATKARMPTSTAKASPPSSRG